MDRTMFEIDVKGMIELEGGRPPHRLAFEPIANVFDEFRGYSDRRKPTKCEVELEHSANPRGIWLTVRDDGPGFANEADIWTFFGHTAKRDQPGVAGRFNAGDKQLMAVAREATVESGSLTVRFADGRREKTRHRDVIREGVQISALMSWTKEEFSEVRRELRGIIPPNGLDYSVNGEYVSRPTRKCDVLATLPTVTRVDGILKPTIRKCHVEVFAPHEDAMLCELGIPVCSLAEVGFPSTLDVQQKIPVPLSRDMVQTSYLYRLIGSVLEQAAMDGVQLLTESEQGQSFLRDSLEWVKEPAALDAVVKSVFGENAVRQSSDPTANAKAASAGATIIPGRWFGGQTRKRFDVNGFLPTSRDKFGGAESVPGMAPEVSKTVCPLCNGTGLRPTS